MTLLEIQEKAGHLPDDGNALSVIPAAALVAEIERRKFTLSKELAILNRRKIGNDPNRLAKDVTAAIRMAATLFSLKQSDIHGTTRTAEIVRARFAAWYALRSNGHTLESIAEGFGGREHGTIMNGVERCVEFMIQDDLYRTQVEEITLSIS